MCGIDKTAASFEEAVRTALKDLQGAYALCMLSQKDDKTLIAAKLGSPMVIGIKACGTSWHAALAGKYLIEEHCRIPVDVEIASEFRYRDPLVSEKTLVIPISQSGETADTLAALREAKCKDAHIVSICNVIDSSIPRESDGVIYTHAGLEIGVKVRSNMEEIISRGGKAIAFCSEGDLETGRRAECSLIIPWAGEDLSSVLYAVALQLLAYNFAILKGKDVDQPRNLAKSVTVE